jgi:hypothetical protein
MTTIDKEKDKTRPKTTKTTKITISPKRRLDKCNIEKTSYIHYDDAHRKDQVRLFRRSNLSHMAYHT